MLFYNSKNEKQKFQEKMVDMELINNKIIHLYYPCIF